MLGQILTQITQGSKEKNSIIQRLSQQNQEITNQIQHIQEGLNDLPLKEIMQFVDGSTTATSIHMNQTDKIQQVFSIIQQFYAVSSKSQKDNKRCEYLQEEIKVILDLVHHYDLFGTLQLNGEPSSQANLNYFKELIEETSQQILQYQNQQNINKFENQHEEVCQQYENVIQFYKRFKNLVIFIYESSIKSNYYFKQNVFKVKKQYFTAVWTEKDSFHQDFLSKLSKFFDKFITYDINDRQYSMSSYNLKTSPQELQISWTSKIIFDSNEISLHYEQLITSLSILRNFFNELEAITPSQKQSLISSAKKEILQQIKSYIEYLLPYLTMDLRRKLLSHFSVKVTAQSLNIYELLVSLRMCGKDADMLVQTIKHIIEKIREDAKTLPIVLKFIDLAKQNKKNYNMNFFVCNQIIQQLEEGEVNTEMADAIKRLLIIREEMRMKIHNFDGKQ